MKVFVKFEMRSPLCISRAIAHALIYNALLHRFQTKIISFWPLRKHQFIAGISATGNLTNNAT